ncbi:hypothetical protein AAG570_007585 [Ranatra chinensis]|uniref:CUB domain-containing protein n=1 Tax=Ranatra chinensis TaxID=642074 RepID=A0ABD0XU02_9HEMI
MKKHARDSTGKFQTQETFISTGNIMSILLRRLQQGAQHADPDFVDGAFLFHDEHVDGTLQPETLCDVDFYGLSSGKVVSLSRLPLDSNCQTACGDGGCRCLPKESGDLSTVNHLVLTTSEGKPLSCLCGDFQQEWLPVGLRSWSPITLVYSVAQYSWTMKGFNFQADFIFHSDNTCGHQVINQHSGTIVSGPLEGGNQLNYYFHQSCTWLLDSNVERQLTLDFESIQNRPCTAWNLTIHEYNEISPERTGKLLHTFCPRFVQKNYSLPWKLNIIIIRLNAMTRMPPEFVIKWKSQIVRTNTRLAGATPAQTSRAILWKHSLIVIIPIILSLN